MSCQFVFNEKVYAESVLEKQVARLQAATGIIVGSKETQSSGKTKYTMYDVMLTPNPSETGAAKEDKKGKGGKAGNKNLSELLNTSFDGFKYSDWVAEYNLTVQKMLSQGMSCIGLYVYCENEQARRLSQRKIDALINRMRTHYHDSKRKKSEEESKEEEETQQMRLSDDEKDETAADGGISFNDFLVVCQMRGTEKPEVFKLNNGAINWLEKLTVKTQPIFDTMVLCDATVDLSTCSLDLTRKGIVEEPRLFGDLIMTIAESIKGQMRQGILKLGDSHTLLTASKHSKTVYQCLQGVNQKQPQKKGVKGKVRDFREHGLQTLSLSFLQPKFKNALQAKARSFSLKGKMHVQAVCSEQMTLRDVIEALTIDLQRQFKFRLEVLEEETQQQLVDPFKLTSDNMQKANNFEIYLPARKLFTTMQAQGKSVRVLGGLVPLNDYQTIDEMQQEAMKRIWSCTGLRVHKSAAEDDQEEEQQSQYFMTMEPLTDEKKVAMIKGRQGKSTCDEHEGMDQKEANDGEDEEKGCMERMQGFIMSGTFTGILVFFLLMDISSYIGGSGDQDS